MHDLGLIIEESQSPKLPSLTVPQTNTLWMKYASFILLLLGGNLEQRGEGKQWGEKAVELICDLLRQALKQLSL